MILASTKERLLQYLEFKGISIKDFLLKTGIKRGFLDTDKLKATVSDKFIATIIANYDDLSLQWLVNGSGEMLEIKPNEINKISKAKIIDNNIENKIINAHKETIEILKREVEDLRSDKEFLKNVIDNGMGKGIAS